MFCTVYPLRRLGNLLKPASPFYMSGRDGLLTCENGEAHLHDLESGHLIGRLVNARVLKARDGGLLIAGEELKFRGLKSKGEASRQTWWCVPTAKVSAARKPLDPIPETS